MADSLSDNIPRLTMSYDIELSGSVKRVELPLVIAILADLTPNPDEPLAPLEERRLLEINLDNFDERMNAFQPRVAFKVPHPLHPASDELLLDCRPRALSDFNPEALISTADALVPLAEERRGLSEIRDKLRATPEIGDVLLQFIRAPGFQALVPIPPREENSIGSDPPERKAAQEPYTEIARRLKADADRAAKLIGIVHALLKGKRGAEYGNLCPLVEERLAHLDRVLSNALNLILHHPGFQRLESAWRGVHHLVGRLGSSTGPVCRIMHVTKAELEKDFRQAARFDRSVLFRKLREEFVTIGGQPCSLIVANYAFDHSDTFLLDQLARVAQASSAVVIAGAAPGVMGLEDFSELSLPRDLSKIFATPDYTCWRELREMECASHVALSLPQILGRTPWLINESDSSHRSFDFEEKIEKHTDYLWVNSGFALAERIAAAFERTGWFEDICGPQGGGVVESLPTHSVPTLEGAGGLITFCPTEINISDRREQELCKNGFNSLVHCKGTDYAVFFHARTLYRPKTFDNPADNAAEETKTELSVILAANRIVHNLLCQIRDRIGGFPDITSCEKMLQEWLIGYACDPQSSTFTRLKYPLSSARVDVVWAPESLGGPMIVSDLEYAPPSRERSVHVHRKIPVSLRLE